MGFDLNLDQSVNESEMDAPASDVLEMDALAPCVPEMDASAEQGFVS
jgi:hypothetical protein